MPALCVAVSRDSILRLLGSPRHQLHVVDLPIVLLQGQAPQFAAGDTAPMLRHLKMRHHSTQTAELELYELISNIPRTSDLGTCK